MKRYFSARFWSLRSPLSSGNNGCSKKAFRALTGKNPDSGPLCRAGCRSGCLLISIRYYE